MNLSNDIWKDERQLRLAFGWLTRIGAAPKFGSMPIHYYQQDQCAAIDAIVKAAAEWGLGVDNLRCVQSGLIQARAGYPGVRAKWHTIAKIICGKIMPQLPPKAIKDYLREIEPSAS